MGRNLPSGPHQALEWLEGHITQWGTNQTTIGLTSASVINLASDLITSRTAYTSVEQIRADSKSKTQAFNNGMKTVQDKAADMIATIKAHAATTGTPATIYTLAGLTQADPRQPVAPPETPTNLTSMLDGLGDVTISWDGRGPTGTVYNVSRMLPTETVFVFLGQGDGRNKSFIDTTVPAGTATVQYSVRAVRGSDLSPPSATLLVRFSSAGGGSASAAA